MSAKRVYVGKYLLAAVLLLSAAAAFMWRYWSNNNSPETQIRLLLTELAGNLSKTPQESTATALVKVKSIADAFANPVDVAMDQYAFGKYDREKILSSLGRYRALIGSAVVMADDINIKITGPGTACGSFSGKFSGTLKSGSSEKLIRDVDVELIALDGKWKIKTLKFTKVLH